MVRKLTSELGRHGAEVFRCAAYCPVSACLLASAADGALPRAPELERRPGETGRPVFEYRKTENPRIRLSFA